MKRVIRIMILLLLIIFFQCSNEQKPTVPDIAIPESVTIVTPDEFYTFRLGFSLVVFKDKLWVFGGSNDILDTAGKAETKFSRDVWNSDDGINWIKITDKMFDDESEYSVIVFKDRLWIIDKSLQAIDEQGINWLREVWSSPDGINWEKANVAPENAPPARFSKLLVFKNSLWAMGGGTSNDIPSKDRIWKSENGVHWKEVITNFPSRYITGRFYPIESKILYIVARRKEKGIWATENGEIWNHVNINEETFNKVFYFQGITARAGFDSVKNNKFLYILGGFGFPTHTEFYSDLLNDVWRSADGVSWERMSERQEETDKYMDDFNTFPARSEHSVVSFKGMLYLTGGQGEGHQVGPDKWEPTNFRDAWVSPDGKKWYELARVKEGK